MLTLLALGTPFGAERIGWEVADILRKFNVANIHTCRHPADLINYFEPSHPCIILDAVISNQTSGTLNLIQPDTLNPNYCRACQGLNLFDVLQLAKNNHQLPENLSILTIDIGPSYLHFFTPFESSQFAYKVADQLDLALPLQEEFHN